jgi:D-glycero-D-manno-heptose 1,7-bisphosphate phosphatase
VICDIYFIEWSAKSPDTLGVSSLRKAVFLDRDGVLNQDPPHYAHSLDQMVMIPQVDDAVKLLKDHGYFLVIISNQSGVARGYYPEEQVAIFNEALLKEIRKKGGDIDVIYYCPHHPDATIEKYRMDCSCRKPKPGMILQATKTYDIDLKRSFFVGDKTTDVETGKNAGVQTILVLSGQGQDAVEKIKPGDCMVALNLFDAVKKFIINREDKIG